MVHFRVSAITHVYVYMYNYCTKYFSYCFVVYQVAEMVESLEDVGTFDANIGPSCNSVLKQVDGRRAELTNNSHAALLQEEINQVLTLSDHVQYMLLCVTEIIDTYQIWRIHAHVMLYNVHV